MQQSGLFTTRDLIFTGNQDPDKNAIECPGYQPLTYRGLREQVLSVVKNLNARGFHRNDRIAVVMPAGPETAVIIISVMAGFTAIPLNPQAREHEYEVSFSELRVRAVIVQAGSETAAAKVAESNNIPVIELLPDNHTAGKFELRPLVEPVLEEAEFATPSDISHIYLTSGTTARPKIVPVLQKQSCISRQRNFRPLQISDADRCLHIVPYYHAAGIGAPLLSILLAGGTVICTKDFIPSDFFGLLTTYRPTLYSAGPALHRGILRELKKVPRELREHHSLRFIRSGSAAMPAALLDEMEEFFGVPVIDTYASSETGPLSVNFPPKRGSAGLPVIENLKILHDPLESPVSSGHGEIVVKGETVFSGYENAPEETKAAFADGWFKTGDIGYLDNDGYLFISGRKKELINKGGEKFFFQEIDTVLASCPGVREAMTFRIDDPVLGEDVAAMVVRADETLSEHHLRSCLLERLVPFKVPKRIFFADELPKSPTGKLLRYAGTERYTNGISEPDLTSAVSSGSTSVPESPVEAKLMQVWNAVLDGVSLSADTDFFRAGGNSLSAIVLLIKIQRAFNVTLPADTIYLCPTIRHQVEIIAQKTMTRAQYHPLIVPLREQGILPPLFCIHPLGGWIKEYQYISLFLDQDRPVFGIRARGLEPEEKPALTIEEAAREYREAIKTVQKDGPYHLLGFSAGAVYAFELACQFQTRGEGISYLGIIDASAPSPQRKLFNLTKGLGSHSFLATGHRLYLFMRNRLKTDHDTILYPLFVKVVSLLSRGLLYLKDTNLISVSDQESDSIVGDERDEWILKTFPKEQQPLVRTLSRALSNYRPGIFSGDITLFSTGPDLEFFPGDTTRGWRAFITGTTHVADVPGDHNTLHEDPLGRVTAQKIDESLKVG